MVRVRAVLDLLRDAFDVELADLLKKRHPDAVDVLGNNTGPVALTVSWRTSLRSRSGRAAQVTILQTQDVECDEHRVATTTQ